MTTVTCCRFGAEPGEERLAGREIGEVQPHPLERAARLLAPHLLFLVLRDPGQIHLDPP